MKNRLKAWLKFVLLVGVILCIFNANALAQEGSDNYCRNTVMNETAAAFNTMGYWFLDDVIVQIRDYNLGLWAPFLYIFVVFFGLMGVAMGSPPRNYVWYLFGPAIYGWLIFTPTKYPPKGVCWLIGNQEEVWQRAEVGVINLNDAQSRVGSYSIKKGPSNFAVNIPMVFMMVDSVISAQVEFLVAWAGITKQRKNESGTSGLHDVPNAVAIYSANAGNVGADGNSKTVNPWAIMSNSKWPMLEDITGASISNADLKEAFVRFLASECGDTVAEYMDRAAYSSAKNPRNNKLPETVFQSGQTDLGSDLHKALKGKFVPFPPELRAFMSAQKENDQTSFRNFSPAIQNQYSGDPAVIDKAAIDCMTFFYDVVQGIRWESGHTYNQLIGAAQANARANLSADIVNYSFLYGWYVSSKEGKSYIQLTEEQQRDFVKAMVLLYTFKNELNIISVPIYDRYGSASERQKAYVEASAAMGGTTKYGELYMWALLMPYMQGIALYFLSAAYPFACMAMVIPGWHKVMLTWAGFYAWAKSWDAGFAVVMSLERSIWAIMGSSSDTSRINNRIYQFSQDVDSVGLINGGDGSTDTAVTNATCDETAREHALIGCLKPLVFDSKSGGQEDDVALKTFDYALLLQASLKHDTLNAYYVYLMSALYFMVPAVTGQLLLGAKAGFAGMFTQGVSGAAQEHGRAANAGKQGEVFTDTTNNQAVAGHEGFAKSLRGDGNFAKKAYDQATAKMGLGLASSQVGLKSSMVDTQGRMLGHAASMASSAAQMTGSSPKGVSNVMFGASGLGNFIGDIGNFMTNSSGASQASNANAAGGNGLGTGGGVNGQRGVPVGGTLLPNGTVTSSGSVGNSAGMQSASTQQGGVVTNGVKTGIGAAIAAYGAINPAGAGAVLSQGSSLFSSKVNAAALGESAMYSMQGTALGAQSSFNDFASGRYGEMGGYQAAYAQRKQTRDVGRAMAGRMSAIGMMNTSFGAPNMPTNQNAMISMGMSSPTGVQDPTGGLGSMVNSITSAANSYGSSLYNQGQFYGNMNYGAALVNSFNMTDSAFLGNSMPYYNSVLNAIIKGQGHVDDLLGKVQGAWGDNKSQTPVTT